MSSTRRQADAVYLHHMMDAIDEIQGYIQGRSRSDLESDHMFRDAVIRQLQIIGEACRGISEELRRRNPEVPWRRIIGTRNRIIHAYFSVDLAVIWDVATSELPALRVQLASILSSLESGPNAS